MNKIMSSIFPNTNEMYQEPIWEITENEFEIVKKCFYIPNKEIDFVFYTDYNRDEAMCISKKLNGMSDSVAVRIADFINEILIEYQGITISSNQ